MLETLAAFENDVAQFSPRWVQIWVNILGAVVLPTILVCLSRRVLWPAALLIFLGLPATVTLYSIFGYERIMGLGHVLFWTPALIYLWRIRVALRIGESLIGKWLVIAACVMGVSLLFDCFDVIRWFLGAKQ